MRCYNERDLLLDTLWHETTNASQSRGIIKHKKYGRAVSFTHSYTKEARIFAQTSAMVIECHACFCTEILYDTVYRVRQGHLRDTCTPVIKKTSGDIVDVAKSDLVLRGKSSSGPLRAHLFSSLELGCKKQGNSHYGVAPEFRGFERAVN